MLLVEVMRMGQGGVAIARLPSGKICLIEGGLPGEQLQIEIIEEKKDFCRAKIVRIEVAHAQRVEPACKYYGNCGGCNMQHASDTLQIDLHREIVESTFRRQARFGLPADWAIRFGNPWNYRNRARVLMQKQKWGFHGRRSTAMVPVPQCPVLHTAVQGLATHIAGQSKSDQELDLFASEELALVGAQNGLQTVCGKRFSLDAEVFFQSNLEVLPLLINDVMEHALGTSHAVDLFSGVGLFAAFLADRYAIVDAVEWDTRCLEHAQKHLPADKCRFVSLPAQDWMATVAKGSVDYLVVDPPRSGLPPTLLESLHRLSPQRIAYVSCDVPTLARDAALLAAKGFNLIKAFGYLFYPQTSHFEMLTIWDAPING